MPYSMNVVVFRSRIEAMACYGRAREQVSGKQPRDRYLGSVVKISARAFRACFERKSRNTIIVNVVTFGKAERWDDNSRV